MTKKKNVLQEHTDRILEEAVSARRLQEFSEVHFLGEKGVTDPGRHFANYGNMISNRMLSLYDDCTLLVQNKRLPAACVLARCLLETYAVGDFAREEVTKAFNKGGIGEAGKIVLAYINSSRLKVEEQKRFKTKKFSKKDYHFTTQALIRMEQEEAASKHILNALRHLFNREMSITGRAESQFEMLYEQLSEWTHPSQTSLFHAFARSTWDIETSVGRVSLWDGALSACGRGMHCITALTELRENIRDVATQLSKNYLNP